MPLDNKQKNALKEKFKEHRRQTWRGETSQSKKNKIKNDEDDIQTVTDARKTHTIDDYRDSDSLSRRQPSIDDSDIPTDIVGTEDDTVIDDDRSGKKTDDTEQYELLEFENEIDQFHLNSHSEIFEEVEDEFENNQNEKKVRFTWKLVLAVIAGITGAIGSGVLLGYFLASYL